MRLAPLLLAVLIGGGLAAPAVAQEATEAEEAEEGDYGGLVPGPGREAVYFTCRACHSLKQFTQQRMSREDWDGVIDRMVRENHMAEPEPWVRTLILAYLSTHFALEEEEWAGLPPGPGREEVFYTCQACHSLRLVIQQGLTRHAWEETLVWMVEEQGMPEPDEETWDLMLDYLASEYGPERPNFPSAN